ncbi:unnamed protein product [Phaedon cochleariae]|uniref:Adenosine kinase n=1 Tax=Phaedon cochleariae TaxID=80249 RepID=A0A9P0DKS6_PHACE|nr:unnamed protein product [Phaedon cochleariae]
MKRVVAFGNPLLDTTVFINDSYLLNKYNLQDDGQKEIGLEEMERLSSDIKSYKEYYTAGGCSQNALRVLQWLLQKQCEATIFGSVGHDQEANILKKLIEDDGVTTRYILQENLPTGKTIALVKELNRSLVAYLGAAENLPLESLLAETEFHDYLKNADFIYMEGFFLTNRVNAAQYILNLCNQINKIFIFNISGEYLLNILPDTVKYFVENSDVVFGNKREYEALRNQMGMRSLEELADYIIKNGKNRMKEYGKIVIITDGANMGKCFYGGDRIHNFVVPLLNTEDIKDTTGAGDAFTGGFIAGLCSEKSIEECAKIGCYAAHEIIKQTGCSIPRFIPNILE